MNDKELLLKSMRIAILNLRTYIAEIEFVGAALSSSAMTMEDACERLDEAGLLYHLPSAERAVAA